MKEQMTPEQIRTAGIRALVQALGPIGMVRFLQQFNLGYGNYTKEREKWLGHLTVEQIVTEIEKESELLRDEKIKRVHGSRYNLLSL